MILRAKSFTSRVNFKGAMTIAGRFLRILQLAGGITAEQHKDVVKHRQHENSALEPFLPLFNVAKIFIFAVFIFFNPLKDIFCLFSPPVLGRKSQNLIKDIEIIA